MRIRISLNPRDPARVPGATPAVRVGVVPDPMGASTRLRPSWSVLWQVILCCAPTSFFIYEAQLFAAVVVFHGLLGMLACYYIVRGQVIHMTALFVGCVPMLLLLRPVFYHNSISVIFAATLLMWSILNPAEIRHLMRDRLVFSFCLFAFAYWWFSFLVTGFYATNLRIFELVFGAAMVFLLSRFRSYLAPALWGVGASTLFIVAGISRYGRDRLGMAEFGHQILGHPQQVGMACALILILCLADRGRWLNLNRSTLWRYATAAAATAMLLLTTSRTSWLLTIAALTTLVLARGQRRYLVSSALIVMLVLTALLATSRREAILKYADKALSPKRSLSQRTSGRYDMYAAFPGLFWKSPMWGLGPGAADDAYHTREGAAVVMHSIFLHLGLELGSLGLGVLLVSYTAFVRRAWIHRRLTGEVVPLAFALACCVDALAHNSFNPLTGIFLGLALTDLSRLRAYRLAPVAKRRAPREAAATQLVDIRDRSEVSASQ
jgi:O-antigen ligase